MTDTLFKIEKGIPPPATWRKYPWREMEPGDSFFVPCEDKAERRKTVKNLITAARNFAKSMPLGDRKFTVRQVDGGVRAWRLE